MVNFSRDFKNNIFYANVKRGRGGGCGGGRRDAINRVSTKRNANTTKIITTTNSREKIMNKNKLFNQTL
jgi:hypothetical protein